MGLLAVALLGGCAQGTTGIDKSKLESGIASESNKQLQSSGFSARVSSVGCIEDGDAFHFVCLVKATDGSTATFKATCDRTGGGSCVWRPE